MTDDPVALLACVLALIAVSITCAILFVGFRVGDLADAIREEVKREKH
jgi:hypothetical protein